MDNEKIYRKALALEPLTAGEAMRLYDTAPTGELTLLAWELRQKQVPGDVVTWQIDRNVNITNVCISGCKFCNFHCKPHQTERAYVTTIEQYARWAATNCCCRAACTRNWGSIFTKTCSGS